MINVTAFTETSLGSGVEVEVKNHRRRIKIVFGIKHRSGDWLDGWIEVPLSNTDAEQLLCKLAHAIRYNMCPGQIPQVIIQCNHPPTEENPCKTPKRRTSTARRSSSRTPAARRR